MTRQIYKFDNFLLDAANRQLLRDGESVQLSARAFDLLETLVESNGRLVAKDEIFSRVWHDQIVEESNLTVHISQIRKALGESKNKQRFIKTIPGFGYRFVSEVSNLADEDFVVETQTISRITIEKEVGDSNDAKNLPVQKTNQKAVLTAPNKIETAKRSLFKYLAAPAAAVLVCLSIFGIYKLWNGKNSVAAFEKIKLTRLTNNGKVAGAAVSGDGKFLAYVLSEAEGNSLWLRQIVTGGDIPLLPPAKAEFWGLAFSPDGAYLYYNLFAGDKTDVELFRIPSFGGMREKIPNVIAGSVGFSPDGKRIAYVQSDSAENSNYLVVADADGGNNQIVAKKKHPNTFEFNGRLTSWSPDGETIACLVNHFDSDASYSSIVAVNPKDGTEKLLSERRWYDVFSLEWLKDGSGLLISASEKVSGRNQIWFLPNSQSEARQITNDLNGYGWTNATADGKSFVVVQHNTVNSISVGEIGGDANSFKELASETGSLNPLVWMPDGKIVFRSDKDGVSNLWTMDADGGNRRQLTKNAQVDTRGLCASPDGKYLVFGSWRNGKSNIWRVDADGVNLTQLTTGEADVYPRCSPDGKWVVYQKGLHTKPMLWKVPVEGGEPVQLTDFWAKWAAVSNDGSRISYLQMAEGKWRIGFISSKGERIAARLDAPADLSESVVRWSPDNQSLFYIGATGSVGNIQALPLDGSSVKPMTNFSSRLLSDFSLSPDGKRLAATQTLNMSDVILIENVTAP